MRSLLLALSTAATLSFAGVGAQAMPAQAVAGGVSPHIILVGGGCGPGFHPGPGGLCRPNRGAVVVERPAVVVRPAPAVVVRRPAVVVRPGCGVRVGPIGVRTPC